MREIALLENIERVHTTQKGKERIKKNVCLLVDDVTSWCKDKILNADLVVRKGKNWYVYAEGCVITINASTYTILTAHPA